MKLRKAATRTKSQPCVLPATINPQPVSMAIEEGLSAITFVNVVIMLCLSGFLHTEPFLTATKYHYLPE